MYQTLDVVLRAVPRQSFRARSKCESAPGPSAADADVRPEAPPAQTVTIKDTAAIQGRIRATRRRYNTGGGRDNPCAFNRPGPDQSRPAVLADEERPGWIEKMAQIFVS